jgi:hypothetical protein
MAPSSKVVSSDVCVGRWQQEQLASIGAWDSKSAGQCVRWCTKRRGDRMKYGYGKREWEAEAWRKEVQAVGW